MNSLPVLNKQELAFVEAIFAKLPMAVASRRAGIPENTGRNWIAREDIRAHLQFLSDKAAEHLVQKFSYSAEDAHLDIEMGKRMAGTAMEWFKGVELHMKLHGLGQEKAAGTQVNVNIANISKAEQLEVLDDAQLLELAGDSYQRLVPEASDG